MLRQHLRRAAATVSLNSLLGMDGSIMIYSPYSIMLHNGACKEPW